MLLALYVHWVFGYMDGRMTQEKGFAQGAQCVCGCVWVWVREWGKKCWGHHLPGSKSWLAYTLAALWSAVCLAFRGNRNKYRQTENERERMILFKVWNGDKHVMFLCNIVIKSKTSSDTDIKRSSIPAFHMNNCKLLIVSHLPLVMSNLNPVTAV